MQQQTKKTTNATTPHEPSESLEVKKKQLLRQRQALPIYPVRDQIVNEIENKKSVIIIGETGSGKTTQIPQFLVDARLGRKGLMIAVTQPRRVAAITIAKRVSEEMGVKLGKEVGYTVRFDDVTSRDTIIKYMTDGMLVREAMLDPNLSKYGVIILDEAHERTLHTDVLFAVAKAAQAKRPSLKIVIMSATLDADQFMKYFGAEVLFLEGRQFPVETFYTQEPQKDYLDSTLTTILQIHTGIGLKDLYNVENNDGDILVFLTGREEIDSVEQMLREKIPLLPPKSKNLLVCPIYASLPPELQLKVFEKAPPNTRKVILATNIAETSITINGIRFVIDSGVVKMRSYLAKIGLDTLMVLPISKASARQRAGRAGREAPGICFRLYTEEAFSSFIENTVPEIKRSNLTHVVLQLKAMGINDIVNFDYIDRPRSEFLTKALEVLLCIGALNEEGEINDLGKKMAGLPLEPMFAKTVILAHEFNCVNEVITIVAMLSVETIFYSLKDQRKEAESAREAFISSDGDHLTLLNVFREFSRFLKGKSDGNYEISKSAQRWCRENFINAKSMAKVVNTRDQILEYVLSLNLQTKQDKTGIEESQRIRKCFVGGFFMQTAMLDKDTKQYMTTLDKREVSIHPSSVLFGKKLPYVVFNELVSTSKPYIRDISTIEQEWLPEAAPHLFENIETKIPLKTQTKDSKVEDSHKKQKTESLKTRVMNGMVEYIPDKYL